MIFPLWPPVAIIALLMMLLIMVILIYGDKIFARVKTQTDRFGVRARPEPMMRVGGSERVRYAAPQQQQPPPEFHHQQEIIQQRYSPQQQHQYQQRYEAPMELQKQSTTYGHREIEV